MFKFLNKLLLLIFVFSYVVTSGQFIRVNNDSISFGNDSIAILTIPHYRGNLFWQQSLDRENWITSNLNNKDSISVSLEFGSYYRACVREWTCDPIISDIVSITIPDSVNVLYDDSLLEMAYPDSLGIIRRFFNDEDTLSCLVINDEFVYQGDIILTSDQINRFLKLKGAGIGHGQLVNLWPNNTVYYSTSGSCLNPLYWLLCVDLQIALNHWENNTLFRFEKRTDEPNYIDFVFNTDNKSSSKLGMIGGRQEICLGTGSTDGTIIHEIGHALGLAHETNRPDWDKWININFNNIIDNQDYKDQFIYDGFGIGDGPFDYVSVMLYPSKIRRISIDPRQPILSRKSDGLIWAGQRNRLSKGDIEMINILYQPLKVFTDYPEKNDFTPFGVYVGGYVATDNGSPIIARGVCWSTHRHPTKDNNKTVDGTGLGQFYSQISGLVPNTTYWVRAYASNANETAYGNEYRFDTPVYENALNTFMDSRDQNLYKNVQIGSQVWMAENLAYLPAVSPPTEGSSKNPYYYVYGYSGTDVAAAKLTSNYATYGVLYNWPAALAGSGSSNAVPSGVKGVCPDGWHLPSDDEWNVFLNYLIDNGYSYISSSAQIAKSLAANEKWKTHPWEGNPGNDLPSNNKSGFSGLPGGLRSWRNFFGGLEEHGSWWTSTGFFLLGDPVIGNFVSLYYDIPSIMESNEDSEVGYSVRCVKDN